MADGADGNSFSIDTAKWPDPELGTEPISGDRYYSDTFMQKEWGGDVDQVLADRLFEQ